MIVDGKALAEESKVELKATLRQAQGKKLRLAVVWVGDNTVSEKYVARKKKVGEEIGVDVVVHDLMGDISQSDLEGEIEKLNNDERVNGIIVQLPLSKQIDEQKILNLVTPAKDVYALRNEARVLSPTVGAIKEILNRNLVS
ncbi:MAG: hypothetical protein NT041_00740, partial [Candidatus Vogelbacteria bacterium]|nr:hypothetical protein [Candidatus Vogelbacteria bacterium]